MQITQQQYEQVQDLLPRQRGNVTFDNLDVVYTFFVYFSLIVDALNSVNTPLSESDISLNWPDPLSVHFTSQA